MTINDDKFNYDEYSRNLDRADAFSQPDRSSGGLKAFVQREMQAQAASSGTNTTLIPGKLYLRQQPSGLWELTHNRGRGTFDCYTGETREEMLALAESLQEGGN
jgi:hypothetical protein